MADPEIQPTDSAEPTPHATSPTTEAPSDREDWQVGASAGRSLTRMADFLAAEDSAAALRVWIGTGRAMSRAEILQCLERDIVAIDELVTEQVNAIMHHPDFQSLEAGWRGVEYLLDCAAEGDDWGERGIKIKILNVTWREVDRDLQRAVEFDQSELWKKIYEYDFGVAGGEPFGLMLGNYEILPWPTREHPQDDIDVLTKLSGIAAAAFCPFIAAVNPAMFGLNEFRSLEIVDDLVSGFRQPEYRRWRQFREMEDARFVGLTMPRVLMRPPYEPGRQEADFCFEEKVVGPDLSKYLWGNAAFAFGEVAIRSFAQSGWLAGIRGFHRDELGGGLVANLPRHCFGTDSWGTARKTSVETAILESEDSVFSELGFIPLCSTPDTEFCVFYSNQSTQKPRSYDEQDAENNAKLATMLQYLLCTSRFAHYLKVLLRESLGSAKEPADIERKLDRWIKNYVNNDDHSRPEVKARLPLRQARVMVKRDLSDAGRYHCVFHLQPHYQLDKLEGGVRLTTTIQQSS